MQFGIYITFKNNLHTSRLHSACVFFFFFAILQGITFSIIFNYVMYSCMGVPANIEVYFIDLFLETQNLRVNA